jgi:hypothetical protein
MRKSFLNNQEQDALYGDYRSVIDITPGFVGD